MHAALWLAPLALVGRAATEHSVNHDVYALIADAGSTGTRVYLFHLAPSSAEREKPSRVEISDLGKGPALSSFVGSPENAADAVRQQLYKAKQLIPTEAHGSVPVSIFATAGMRLVERQAQEAIYAGLKAGLIQDNISFRADALQARTISGREEGVFAMLAANYLADHMRSSLQAVTGRLMGVLDLGGSSTQVAVPPADISIGESLTSKLGEENTFVRSFLKLGMERMRQRTYERFVSVAPASQREKRAVSNPCAFYGYSEATESWRGTGDASSCYDGVVAILRSEQTACAQAPASEGNDCLSGAPVAVQGGSHEEAKFFMISGYLYVTDFARWWFSQQGVRTESVKDLLAEGGAFGSPTIQEIRQAAQVVCAEPWDTLSALANDPTHSHKFTKPHKVPHRCFELNYIAALLAVGYGFDEDLRLFRIVADVDGGEIEWTLGAFLHSMASPVSEQEL